MRSPGSWRRTDFLGLDCGETVDGGRQGRYRRCRSTYGRAWTATTHRAHTGQYEEAGQETLAKAPGCELLGLGHPGTVQELVERRIHDVGDRVPTN